MRKRVEHTSGRRLGDDAGNQSHAVSFACVRRLERSTEARRRQSGPNDELSAGFSGAGRVARDAQVAAGVRFAHCGDGELEAAVARARLERRHRVTDLSVVFEPLKHTEVQVTRTLFTGLISSHFISLPLISSHLVVIYWNYICNAVSRPKPKQRQITSESNNWLKSNVNCSKYLKVLH